MNVIALVPLDDRDERQSGALTRFRGTPLLVHAIRGLLRAECVDRVFVSGPPQQLPVYSAALDADADARVGLVAGAGSRGASLRLALAASGAGGTDAVLVHDAARPFVPPAVIRAVVDALRDGAQAVVPVELVTDTIKVVDEAGRIVGTRDRDRLRSLQAPQGFQAGILRHADPADPITALGATVRTVAGHPLGMRLTTAFDLAVMESLLAESEAG